GSLLLGRSRALRCALETLEVLEDVELHVASSSISQREHPHYAALRHLRFGAQERVQTRLHALRVDTPAGLHRHVLHAVDGERARHTSAAGVGPDLPELLARLRVERAEVTVVSAAEEHEPAAGGEDRPPVLIREFVSPHPLPRLHVPRLELADVCRAL